ncbi:transposase IS630 [Komagataeibacter europaeus NBRC 3261]|uniref:Transposase IS630 n=1 Tax=Komagataeibacter europaeus NBRC 3261 TaxID=1234669 RepID=A0A0D6Q496_KOMEU|nr:transposase IS630 [Komagataeibacter europaeus NBRC 3261]
MGTTSLGQHATAYRGNLSLRRTRSACRRPARSCRLAYDTQTQTAAQRQPDLLPSRAPELNPVENIWQFLRANWLSNTVFSDIEHIIEAACTAWNNLTVLPQTIRSIGLRNWAHIGQR